MVQGFPITKTVMVLAPHPDDEALGCSGTITLLNRKGVSSTVVFLTDGEKLCGDPSSAIGAQRREEAHRASEMLGCKEPVFLGLPDGEVGDHLEDGCAKLAGFIAVKNPDIIFAPSPIDHHHDHTATANIALKLLEDHRSFKVAFYEVYSTVRFTHLVDIAEVVEEKRKVILNYRTSLYGNPEAYLHASLGLNAQRSIFAQREGYYEAFWIVEKSLNREAIIDWLTYRPR